jgi:DNA-binding CsgD family transcriptional regulator
VGALSLARRLGFPDELFYAAALCISFAQAPLHEHDRLGLAEEMLNRPVEGVSARTLAAFYLYVGWASWDWGKRAQAIESWRNIHELPGLFRDSFATLYSLFAEGSLAALEGRLAETIVVADRLITEGDEIGSPVFGRMLSPLLSFRPRLYLGRGEEALALVPLDWQFAGAKEEPAEAKPRRLLILAYLGRRDEALGLLSEIMEARRIGPEEDGTVATSDLLLLLESSVILEDRTTAAALFQRLSSLEMLIKAHPGTLTSVARHLGGAAALFGRYDEARRYYEEALEVCARIGFRPEAALTHLQLAQLLLNHYPSARADASDHLEAAITEFETMDMQPALEQALGLNGRRRPLTQRKAPSYPDGLTEREVQVLRLLATGKSNLQIAQELFISSHTVGHHVGNIFGKIGAANRTEASGYAYREGLMA